MFLSFKLLCIASAAVAGVAHAELDVSRVAFDSTRELQHPNADAVSALGDIATRDSAAISAIATISSSGGSFGSPAAEEAPVFRPQLMSTPPLLLTATPLTAATSSTGTATTLSAAASFQCAVFPAAFDPTLFCSGVVTYPYFLPLGYTEADFHKFARSAGDSLISALSTPCLADLKKRICAEVYLPCAPNVVPDDYSTYLWNGPIPLPFKRPCRSLCEATTYQGSSCGGVLEAIGAAPNCAVTNPATSLATFDSTDDPALCNALPGVSSTAIVGKKFEPYVGSVCQGIVRDFYVPSASALSATLAPLQPPFVVQSILEKILSAAEASFPHFFSPQCLLAQRQLVCSLAFFTPYHVSAFPIFSDFYLPRYPDRSVCENYLAQCSDAILLVPSLAMNCTGTTGVGVPQFPNSPQVITVVAGVPLATPPSRAVLQNVTAAFNTECPFGTAVPRNMHAPNMAAITGTNCALKCPPDIYTTSEKVAIRDVYVYTVSLGFALVCLSLSNIFMVHSKKRNPFVFLFVLLTLLFEFFNLVSIATANAHATDADDFLTRLMCSSETSWNSKEAIGISASSSMCFLTGIVFLFFQSMTFSVVIAAVSELWLRVYWSIKDITLYRYIYISAGLAFGVIELAISLASSDADVTIVGSIFPFCYWKTPDNDYQFKSNTLPSAIVFVMAAAIFIHVLFICVQIALQVQVKGESVLKRIWKSYRLIFLLCIMIFTVYSVTIFYVFIELFYVRAPGLEHAAQKYYSCLFKYFTSSADENYLVQCGLEPTIKSTVGVVQLFSCLMLFLCGSLFAITFTPDVRDFYWRMIPEHVRNGVCGGIAAKAAAAGFDRRKQSVMESSAYVPGQTDQTSQQPAKTAVGMLKSVIQPDAKIAPAADLIEPMKEEHMIREDETIRDESSDKAEGHGAEFGRGSCSEVDLSGAVNANADLQV